MHRTGKYRKLNLVFGLFPFVAAILISLMNENSPAPQLWLSIVSDFEPGCRLARVAADDIRCVDPAWLRKRGCTSDHAQCVSLNFLTF